MVLFEDPDFNYFESWKGKPVQWKRPYELKKNPVFIDDDFVIDDIDQGELGNCWFLSSIGAILQYCPDRLKECLPKNVSLESDNYTGKLTFRFYDLGTPTVVVIDDKLPSRNGRLIFTSSNQSNEYWSALLEKAFAKFQGGYKRLESGIACEGMQCLADMITETIDIKNKTNAELVQIFQNTSACCAGTISGDAKPSGIVMGHGYVINKCITLRTGEQLVEVINPHGHGEWTGDWSDKCPKWKDHLEYKPEVKDDGVFFMSIKDFRIYFDRIYHGLNDRDWNEITPKENSGVFRDSKKQIKRKSCNIREDHYEWIEGFENGGYPVFEFTKTSGKDSDLMIRISQKDLRRSDDEEVFLGFKIVQSKITNIPHFGDVYAYVGGCNSYRSGENSQIFKEIPAGDYKLICSTYEAGKSCDFKVRMFQENASEEHKKNVAEGMQIESLKDQVSNLTRQLLEMDINQQVYKDLLSDLTGTLIEKINAGNAKNLK